MMPVGPQGGDDQKDGHSRKEESTHLMIVALIPEKEKYDYGSHIHKPQEIRHDKQFTERNAVIYGHVDHGVSFGYGLLEAGKPCEIKNAVQEQWYGMPVFFITSS